MAYKATVEWRDSNWMPWMLRSGRPHRTNAVNWRKPILWNAKPFYRCPECGWRGETDSNCPGCASDVLSARRRVFCASLADVFDNEVDPAWRADLFALIEATPNLDWLVLTKRIGNAANMMFLARGGHLPLLPNLWLGATICNQQEADRDIPKLLAVPAAVRFLSVEPMLGPVDIRWTFADAGVIQCPKCRFSTNRLNHGPCPNDGSTLGNDVGVDWVIVGGESGPKARPMHPDWVRSVRDQCEAAGVAFLFKQHGEWLATAFCDDDAAMLPSRRTVYVNRDGSYSDGSDGIDFFHGAEETAWVGKKAAGRQLDGRTHDEFPEVSNG